MRSSVAGILARWATGAAALAAIVTVYTRWVHVNPTTVALTFLLLIQWLAATSGLGLAVVGSAAAALLFNYFFLPPIGAFTIADTQNWVALGAFLTTALIGSNLAGRLHASRAASERRGRELGLLYDLGQRLLIPESTSELLRALPFSIAAAFQCSHAAVYLIDGAQLHTSRPELDLPIQLLQLAAGASHPFAGPLSGSLLVPLAVGVRPIGSIYLAWVAEPLLQNGSGLPKYETLEAMSSLVALSLERAAAVEKLVHAEAASESDRLRATLLDAVTHDLRTPLTSIKAAVSSLLSQSTLRADQRLELLTIIDEESDRLDRLIAQAVEMAQLDARAVRLDRRSCALAPLLEEVLENAQSRWPGRTVRYEAAPGLLPALIDPALVSKVLLHLVENAAKYSTPGKPITVRVLSVPAHARSRWIEVAVKDEGPGIAVDEQEKIFNKFYRSPAQKYHTPGTGMGLPIARAIVEAHGGTLTLESSPAGSAFRFTLPVALPP